MILPNDLCQYCEQYWPQHRPPGIKSTDAVQQSPTMTPDSITIVTAFFDLGRGDWSKSQTEMSRKFDRSVDQYVENFGRLAEIKNDMIIFVSPHLAERVLKLRDVAGLAERTVIYTIANLFEASEISSLRSAITKQSTARFRDFVWRPFVPEVNKPDYVLIMALKPAFANTAIKFGVVRAPQLAWIDFGYAHADNLLDTDIEWTFDAGDRMNLFNIFELDDLPIYDVVRGGEVYFAGCHIVGPIESWPTFNRQISDALQSLLDCNFMDDDQTLMLMAWRREPNAFILRRHRTDTELGWRYIFKRYRTGMDPDTDLPQVRRDSKPAWMRDISTGIRRSVRRWSRGLSKA